MSEKRLRRLMDSVAEGGTYSEIQRRLAKSAAAGIRRNRRGETAERDVLAILSPLASVISIHINLKHSKLDKQGVDLSVNLNPDGSGIDHVRVQVKSSSSGIKDFRRALMNRHHLHPEEIDTWLIEHLFILLNGQQPEDKIITSFETQLQRIKGQK